MTVYGHVSNGVFRALIQPDAPFTINGVPYSAAFIQTASQQDLEAVGIFALDDTPEPDRGFYSVSGGGIRFIENESILRRIWDAVPRDLQDVRQELKARVAQSRWDRVSAGIEVGGIVFKTDVESRSNILGAALEATLDSDYTLKWKGGNGWIFLNAEQVIAAARSIRIHVQAHFDAEASHSAAIDALEDFAAALAYDISTGWPT